MEELVITVKINYCQTKENKCYRCLITCISKYSFRGNNPFSALLLQTSWNIPKDHFQNGTKTSTKVGATKIRKQIISVKFGCSLRERTTYHKLENWGNAKHKLLSPSAWLNTIFLMPISLTRCVKMQSTLQANVTRPMFTSLMKLQWSHGVVFSITLVTCVLNLRVIKAFMSN